MLCIPQSTLPPSSTVPFSFMADVSLQFVFSGDRLLVRDEESPSVMLPEPGPEALGLEVLFRREVGTFDGRRCFAVEVTEGTDGLDGTAFRNLRGMVGVLDEDFLLMAGRAKQVVDWNRTHRFCGRCGTETETLESELAKRCPNCGMTFHPRLSPAAIMLVWRDSELLLARSPHFVKGMYSALAGFVEPGESIEQTVRREVREEVGVEVGEVRYFGSQPWPFPNSLMIGFLAEYESGELHVDPDEIEDAKWFSLGELPSLPPHNAIARQMIDAFVSGHDFRSMPS